MTPTRRAIPYAFVLFSWACTARSPQAASQRDGDATSAEGDRRTHGSASGAAGGGSSGADGTTPKSDVDAGALDAGDATGPVHEGADAGAHAPRLISIDPAHTSSLLGMDVDERLTYVADAQGNRIPDFSRVGFEASLRPIPSVSAVEHVAPGAGDDSARIQAALDAVSKRTLGSDGFRGAVELAPGTYEVGTTLVIRASGVVLRGAGADEHTGTKLVATGTTQRAAISLHGSGKLVETPSTRRAVAAAYVPVGATRVPLVSTDGLSVGDAVVLLRPATDAWIHDIGMDQIEARDGTVQWSAEDYHLHYERTITAIEGNEVELDAPVMTALDPKYGGGFVYRYTFNGRIDHVGVESLRIESTYAAGKETSDEAHAWDGIELDALEHAWVRDVVTLHFGLSGVTVGKGARFVTVQDSQNLDPVSQITGGRRYSFNVDGQRVLVQRCHARGGRHDYVTGARVLGPNVFLDSTAEQTHADIGPHQRWATGVLYDNIRGGQINVQDRGNFGTGHGWAGANHVMWNDEAGDMACQKPPTAHNWCIGFIGQMSSGRFSDRAPGFWESLGAHLTPRSLFLAQLEDAAGADVVRAISSEAQRE